MMVKQFAALLFCAATSMSLAGAETFVIEGEKAGHEATVKIPAGAVVTLSADFAESLVGYAHPRFETMRLSGDVSISVAGSAEPIQIKADDVVLELTPDFDYELPKRSRSDAAANKLLRSTQLLAGGSPQVFVGNVVFDLQTLNGPMEIKADRVEHRLKPDEPAQEAGA